MRRTVKKAAGAWKLQDTTLTDNIAMAEMTYDGLNG